MEIIIGRDESTGKGRISVVGGKTATFGAPKSVPKSVSREHVKLTLVPDKDILITNLNVENSTFVKDHEVEAKFIAEDTPVMLGSDRFPLPWDIIKPLIPHVADIRPLKKVWETYEERMLQAQIRQGKFNVLNRISIIRSLLSGIAGTLFQQMEMNIGVVLSVIVLLVNLVLIFVSYKKASQTPIENKRIREEAESQYCCPRNECGYIFTLMSYDKLAQMKKCPGCGATFKC